MGSSAAALRSIGAREPPRPGEGSSDLADGRARRANGDHFMTARWRAESASARMIGDRPGRSLHRLTVGSAHMREELGTRKRLLTLYVLCLGVLMIVLDTTIVTVALPTIQSKLRFSHAGLTWVLNAYLLTYGGFLLLGGRLGDLYGPRRLFLVGLGVFTLASLACGLAQTQPQLVAARAVQGLGGAVVSAVSLSLIMNLFTDTVERAMAMGIYGFVCAAGGSIAELLGGVLTQTLGWHSVFLVNLPIGVAVYVLCSALLPADRPSLGPRRLDVAGALTITVALMLLVYSVVNANGRGWISMPTGGLFALGIVLILLFVWIEQRTPQPLMPLRLFLLRNLATANIISVLWSAGLFAWFVTSALYLQHVLGYDPLRVGLAFLPADLIMGVFSAGLSARMVVRFGTRGPLWVGVLLTAVGLASFARGPTDGSFVTSVLPGMLLLGLGAGMAFNPLLLVAMNDVHSDESGLASGVVNTSFMMGGALGLAALASWADGRTGELQHAGTAPLAALNAGYHLDFWLGALLAACGALVGARALRARAWSAAPPSIPAGG
jgi:EmrB/QacA subfamily drug resistance transporter